MQNQDEHDNKTDQPLSTTDSNVIENVAGNIKTLLLAIGGLVVVLSILVLLPMFLTYLSEGDVRAPASTTERYSDVGSNLSQGDDSAPKAPGQLNNVFK